MAVNTFLGLQLFLISRIPSTTFHPRLTCLTQILDQFKGQTTLLAIESKFSNPLDFLKNSKSNFVIINENYNQSFKNTYLRVSVVIMNVDNQQTQILKNLKNNRLISDNTTLIGVTEKNDFEFVKEFIINGKRIINPSFIGIVTSGEYYWSIIANDVIHFENSCAVFLTKESDFKGKTLKIVGTNQEPYLMNNNGGIVFYNGIEVSLVLTLAEIMKMDIKWVSFPPNELPRQTTNANGSAIGLIGVLYNFNADLAIAGIQLQPERCDLVSFLYPHTDDALIWAIPGPPEASNWGAMFSTFSITIWSLVTLSFISTVTAYSSIRYIYNKKSPINTALLEAWSILLDQGVVHNPFNYLITFLSGVYMLYSLIITNAYRSALFTALTTTSTASWYTTIEEVVQAGFVFNFMYSATDFLRRASKNTPAVKTILDSGNYKLRPNLTSIIEIGKTRKGAMLCIENVCKLLIQKYLPQRSKISKITFLEKRFVRFPVVAYCSPGSPLCNILKEKQLWILEAGLTNQWLSAIHYTSKLKSFTSSSSSSKQSNDSGPHPLSMHHFLTLFILFISILATAFIIFLVEIIYKKKIKNR